MNASIQGMIEDVISYIFMYHTHRCCEVRLPTQPPLQNTTMFHLHPCLVVASSAAIIALLPSSDIIIFCTAFLSPTRFCSVHSTTIFSSRTRTTSSTSRWNGNQQPDAPKTIQEDAALQWELFTRHQAVFDGEWWGNWMTYNYMGDLVDSSVVG